MKRGVLTAIVAAALVFAVGLGWTSLRRSRELERRLQDANRQVEGLGRQTREQARELDLAVKAAAAARESAEAAAQQARTAAAGRTSAEERAQAAEEARAQAAGQARQSRQELAAMQERRELELNRMHEALARIATTRRTTTGLVIDLANDSFRFDFDRADLRPENREILSRIAGVLLASSGYRLYVDGHTDDIGTAAYNQQLSERRARSVADYLTAAGVDAAVVQTRGFGKSSPRAAGKTPGARQENRRVEIILVDSVIHYDKEVRQSSSH